MIFVVMVDNGQPGYDGHASWPIGYLTEEWNADTYVENVTAYYNRLWDAAKKAQDKRGAKDDWCGLYDTAAGKKLLKYLQDRGIYSRNEEYPSEEHHTFSVLTLLKLRGFK